MLRDSAENMHQRINWSCVLLIIAVCCRLAAAQDGSTIKTNRDVSAYQDRPRVQAVRLNSNETIETDGRLDEPAWQRAIPAKDFVQQDPEYGKPASERTEVRFLFSKNTLYMSVTCFDSEPDKLMGNQMVRDGFLNADDRFIWTLDPYLDGRSGYYFEMNPSGAMGDALISAMDNNNFGGNVPNPGGNFVNDARAWDGIWFAKVARTDVGWTIEIEIPFRTLSFDPNAPAWGINFQRTVRRKNEESLWTGWLRNEGVRRMTNAGLLEGISDVSLGIGLNVQPYVTGKFLEAPGRTPSIDSTYKGDTGIDFTYSVTPQLKANFTINTDFAETEVDQRLVNLTQFPLFFPERRGFFLEGATFFDFAREQGNTIRPFFSRRIGLDSNGQPQRIDYGTKLTGQIGANNIGLLQVRTADSGNLAGENFTVIRSKQRFLRQSYAGIMYTRRALRDTGVPDRQTFGADFEVATSRFRGSQNMSVGAFYLRSTKLPNTTGAAAYGLRLEYPNDRWLARMAYREIQAGYDPAVGFVDRRDERRYNPEFQFAPRPNNSRFIRRIVFRTDDEVITDLQNQPVTRNLQQSVTVDFQSGDVVQFQVSPTYERLRKDFEISQGVLLPNGSAYSYMRYQTQISTANRRVVSVFSSYNVGTFFSGHRRDFELNLGIRPMRGLLLNINNAWNRVELREGKFSTQLLRLVANTQFSPWISVVNNLQYDSVSRILGWQSRFRWIVRPGNDIYFVYAQNWLENPTLGRLTLDRSAATKILYTHRF